MKIQFERSGGFTAIPVRLSLDTSQLEPVAAAELIRLVNESQFKSLPEKILPPEKVRDQFHYRLTVEDGGTSHTVETGDASSPEKLTPLLRHLTLMARSNRPSA